MIGESLMAILISLASLLLGVYTGLSTVRREARAEQRKDASELTTVIVKLEDISAGIGEIKGDLSGVKGDIRELTERMIVAEQQIKQMGARLGELEERR